MKAWGLIALAALPLAGAACDSLDIGNDDNDGAVYTSTNRASGNQVLVFVRDDNGGLTLRDSVATGGLGSGPDPQFGTDPLTSQDAVILSDDHNLLFVVNAGSNEVTSFRVGSTGALTVASRVSSGGTFPVSLAMRGSVLYVLNQKNGGNVSGFRVGTDGTLTAIAGSTRPLSGDPNPSPASVRISPDGRVLVVTEKMTNRLTMYGLNTDGSPASASPTVTNTSAPTPFGADFDPAGHYILSEGNIGPNRAAVPDGSYAGSLGFSGGSLAPSVISAAVPTTETAACWVQITPDGRFAYTTNTGSGSITGFSIGTTGALTLLTADGKTGVTGMNTQPLDMAYADGYLYALTAGDGGIHGFRVGGGGSLTALSGSGTVVSVLPISATGLAAY